MFDAKLRPYIDRPLNSAGRLLAQAGLSANGATFIGLIVGLIAAYSVSMQCYGLGFMLISVNRLMDGLDGAIARATKKTPVGGYLDIVSDFVFYVSIPVAFGMADPTNLFPALLLVAAFTLTGVSFLAFAVIAAEQNIETTAHGEKSFFYSTGIAEGAETIGIFLLMCLLPAYFNLLAWIFVGLCLLTLVQRSIYVWRSFATSSN